MLSPILPAEAIKSLLSAMRACKRGSTEQRVLRAFLCAHNPFKTVNNLLKEHDISLDHEEDITAENTDEIRDEINSSTNNSDNGEKSQNTKRMAKRTYTLSRLDWDPLLVSGSLKEIQRTVSRGTGEQVSFLVRFLFSRQNIQLMSWGTKSITFGKEKIVLPAVTRKRSRAAMFSLYIQACSEASVAAVGRTTFFEVAGTLTARDSKRKAAVDYIAGTLVNDSVEELQRMVRQFVSSETQQDILENIERVQYFVKGSLIETHIGKDGDGYHDSTHALLDVPQDRKTILQVTCKGCLAPFALLGSIKSVIPSERKDALDAVDRCRQNVLEYFSHMQRVKMQQKAMETITREIVENKIHNRAIILADYKMKFEPIRYREKTIDFFGKRGISWHGLVVFYLENLYDENGVYCGPGHLSMLFYDHIVQGDSKQDYIAVASLIEAGFIRVKRDLPFVNEIVLVSDNAGCYQNSMLPIMLPFVAKANKLSLIQFIHSETQDGKSLVDAHFAIAMKHVNTYVAERNDVTTPSALVAALRANGGLANSSAELVRIKRSNPNVVQWEQLYSSESKGLSWMGRNNEYVYRGWSACYRQVSVYCYRYSGIGVPRRCQFTRAGVCKPMEPEHSNIVDITLQNIADLSCDAELIGAETGVTILRQGAICRIIRRRIRKASAGSTSKYFTSIAAEVLEEEDNDISDNEIENDGILCKKCGRDLTSEQRLSQHEEICRQNRLWQGKAFVARAARVCKELMQSNDIRVSSVTEDEICNYVDVSNTTVDGVLSGWARRENNTTLEKESNIQKYQTDLQNLFDRGVANKAHKMSSANMRQQLYQLHGERFDIPTEAQIQRAINSMFTRQKKGTTGSNREYTGQGRLLSVYRDCIDDILRTSEYTMAPRVVSQMVRDVFMKDGSLPESFPTDSQIRNRVSSQKSKHRKENFLLPANTLQ